MLVSLFTPTHDPRYLAETARTVAAQAMPDGLDVEWVIGPNGAADHALVVAAAGVASAAGVSVRVVPLTAQGNIGALKRSLCEAASGDVLMELDHDDLLHPQACARAADEVAVGAGFVGSMAVVYSESGGARLYGTDFGWEHRETVVDAPGSAIHGRAVTYSHGFQPSAASLSSILWAPNHFRAWERGVYWRVGGHDASLTVADDYDLLCRTYLDASPFVVIDQPLYYQRMRTDGGNSWLGQCGKIQAACGQGTARYPDGSRVPAFAQPLTLRDRYLHRLVTREASRRSAPLWDLGGAIGCPAGWRSIDRVGGDLAHDLRERLPFEDGSVFAFRAFDVLEPLESREAAALIGEIYRCLVPGGWLLTRTPADSGVGAACDLSHVSRWNTRTWAYFWSRDLLKYREQAFPGLRAAFQPMRCYEESVTMGPHPCRWTLPYVVADLVALKGQRQPGPKYTEPQE